MTSKPLFEQLADTTLDKTRATYAQRGGEYGDTWASIQPMLLRAVLRKLGLPTLTQDQERAILLAGLSDVKYWRNIGGYKEDSLIDGIAYMASLTEQVSRMDGQAKPEPPDPLCQFTAHLTQDAPPVFAKHRILAHHEVIQDGDEVEGTFGEWSPATCIGQTPGQIGLTYRRKVAA